jgi:hypothetical protein
VIYIFRGVFWRRQSAISQISHRRKWFDCSELQLNIEKSISFLPMRLAAAYSDGPVAPTAAGIGPQMMLRGTIDLAKKTPTNWTFVRITWQ